MSRRRALTDDQAEQLYQEYQLWLANRPKKLAQRYGINVSMVWDYGHRKHKRKAA